jgi:hypothetical protein
MSAFRVSRQRPPAGTSVPFGGVLPDQSGVAPRLSTVAIDLGDPQASERADASARPALTAARRTATFRALRSDFRWFGRSAPPGAVTFHGDLGRRRAAGRCFTAVDPSGAQPVVVFVETWYHRTTQGTATGPLRSRTWRVQL